MKTHEIKSANFQSFHLVLILGLVLTVFAGALVSTKGQTFRYSDAHFGCSGLCVKSTSSCPGGDTPTANSSCPIKTLCCKPVTSKCDPKFRGLVYYSQKDPRWATEKVGTGCTLANIGCSAAVAASMLATYNNCDYNPSTTHKNVFPYLTCDGLALSETVNELVKNGFSAKFVDYSTDPLTMRKNVINYFKNSGRKPLLIGVVIKKPNGSLVDHQTILVGYNSDTGNPIFNDPLFGPFVELESIGYQIRWGTAAAAEVIPPTTP